MLFCGNSLTCQLLGTPPYIDFVVQPLNHICRKEVYGTDTHTDRLTEIQYIFQISEEMLYLVSQPFIRKKSKIHDSKNLVTQIRKPCESTV